MRRLMTILLTGTLCLGIISGCGKKAEATTPEAAASEPTVEPVETEEEVEPEGSDTADSANAGYSNDEIVERARKHSGAPLADLDQVMDNGNLYIHLFEDMGDHLSTWDWYEIDPVTLKGTNFMGEEVDLTQVLKK